MRSPGPREKVTQPDGMPTPTMAAWMRDITDRDYAEPLAAEVAAHAATSALLAALVAQLIVDEVLPEGWPDV